MKLRHTVIRANHNMLINTLFRGTMMYYTHDLFRQSLINFPCIKAESDVDNCCECPRLLENDSKVKKKVWNVRFIPSHHTTLDVYGKHPSL